MPCYPWDYLQNKAVVWLVGHAEAERVRDTLPNKVVYYGPSIKLPLLQDRKYTGVYHLNESVPYVPENKYLCVIHPGNSSSLRNELIQLEKLDLLRTHDGKHWCPKGIILITTN
jgi:hypothetical protein